MSETIYTIDALAKRWGVAPITVYRLVESGKLRAFRVGRAVRISASTVEEYEKGETK